MIVLEQMSRSAVYISRPQNLAGWTIRLLVYLLKYEILQVSHLQLTPQAYSHGLANTQAECRPSRPTVISMMMMSILLQMK